ncbi:MAG: hypothetical protein OD918_01775 [Gammaproteobacteria bacterium]
MPNNLMLDFPVLMNDGGDFLDGVSYDVDAHLIARELKITHTLKGQSFIRQLVKNGDAQFSVLLLYTNSAERQHHPCASKVKEGKNGEITATQEISIAFSYAPRIIPSIVLLHEKTDVLVDAASGLNDFWAHGERFDLPKYARIALSHTLKFDSESVLNLIELNYDQTLGSGEMKVEVNEFAGAGKAPVQLYCGRDVHDALKPVTEAKPKNAADAMQHAIITQVLSTTYAYMQNLGADHEESGVLLAHLDALKSKGLGSWKDDSDHFSPSLAATKMWPYAVTAINGETDADN